MESALCNLTLWHASGVEVPQELLRALARKPGTKVTLVGDPFMALAEVCIAARSGGQSGAPSNARLVILFPEMLTDASEFCAAADTYAPAVPRWLFGPVSNPQLRAIVEDDVIQWSQRHTPPAPASPEVIVHPAAIRDAERAIRTPTSRTGPSPQLRLAGEGPADPVLDNPAVPADASEQLAGHDADAAPPASSSSQLITDEELRMLLGESSTEGQQEHQ